MELTVGLIKQIIKDLPDDVVLADLGYGNTKFNPFNNLKRILLLKADGDWENKTYLTINGMGSHFSGEGEQKSLNFTGKHWDENNIKAD